MKPKLALTMGDPAGIGPEILARVCADPEVLAAADLVLVGRAMVLAEGALAAGLALPRQELVECGPVAQIKPGQPSAASGAQAGAFIARAAQMCLEAQVDGMVTAPVSKEHLNAGGYHFNGHTDMLGSLAGGVKPVMMLAGSRLRVSLVTVHTSLSSVPALISGDAIERTAAITHQWLEKYFGISKPRLAVAALNPHAGENGLLGTEENSLILPAIQQLKSEGMNIAGPFPADTLFWRVLKHKEFDAVICMYHDQGLIPFKIVHFEDGVNVSLGLPFIRTSPDHGTAFDLAGKGVASAASMKAAVIMAAEMARRKAPEK